MKPYYEHAGVTIYHGDCLEVLPALAPVELIVTDPPYGVGINYGEGSDDDAEGYWGWFLPVLEVMRATCPQVMFTHRQAAVRQLPAWDRLCVWYKPRTFSHSVKGWQARWEPIFVYGGTVSFKAKPEHRRPARFDAISVLTTPNNTGHPCPKPELLMRWMIETFDGDVCDPFAGSGTTLVAAKNLGRRAVGIEIEERFCELAAKRLGQEILPFMENRA